MKDQNSLWQVNFIESENYLVHNIAKSYCYFELKNIAKILIFSIRSES